MRRLAFIMLAASLVVAMVASAEMLSFFWTAATREDQWSVLIQFNHFPWEPYINGFYFGAPFVVALGLFSLGWLWRDTWD